MGKLTEARGPKLETTIRKGRAGVESHATRLEQLQVEYVPIGSIEPNKYNPNRQTDADFDLLLLSIREDGFTQPIVALRESRVIVDGEHRWRAAREIGLQEVPVCWVDMTEEQMRISTLRHNRARGSEDPELGAQVLRDLREIGALDWAQQSLKLDDDELKRLLDDTSAAEGLAAESFGESWVPTKQHAGEEVRAGDSQYGFTPAAKEIHRDFGVKLAAASSEQQRVALEMQLRRSTFQLVVQYKDEDAALVRRALGAAPALRVLEMCRKEAARGQESETQG